MIIEKEKKRRRIFRELGYAENEVNELVSLMNILLANYSVHYQKLRNFHWNVVGADFFDIHEQFENQYNDAKVEIDTIAERIRVFGKTPLSTMKDYLEESEIKEANTDLDAMQMVKFIIADYLILMNKMYDVLDAAIEFGDSGTEDMIKGQIKKIEKYHWMMTAFSSKSK